MALSFIGKPISLISHSDVRYRGILAGIDPVASTIQLSNVYSMGTESRRPPNEFIPPVQEPYQYIIFRASEVKDLAVDEPVPQRSVHDDPAVLGASAPGPVPPAGYSPYPAPATAAPAPSVPQQQQPNYPRPAQQPKPSGPQQSPQIPGEAPQPQQPGTPQQQQQQPQQQRSNAGANRRGGNPVQNAAASLESVERALGDLRVSSAQNGGRGGRRGGAPGGGRQTQQPTEQLKVPTTDFDFESMNAKFNKAALAQQQQAAVTAVNGEGSANGESADGDEGKEKANGDGAAATSEKKPVPAYNPQKSFFDSLSSSTSTPAGGAQGGGGRGRRGAGNAGRNRREEERERNVATFGEPGGVGLMGPGAYVGGWGGYGRRGGRPRRGGGQGNQAQAHSGRG